MNDPCVTGIICATDAGREGELIFRLVYQTAQCRKSVRRLWISSMEESAIREGFRAMKPMSAYDNLYQAALCRAQADWLIGMNATRLYSLLYGPTLHIGRVMSPTLAMLSQREKAIAEFRPETYYKVALDTGREICAVSERFDDLNEARRLMDVCNHSPAVVKAVEHTQRKENPPALYDLTSLQRDANKLYGFTAQQTLDYAQGLYEKKLLTYPRTDSRYLTHDMEAGLPELASRVCGALPFADGLEPAIHVETVINDAKVTDHHALIPTTTMPGQEATVKALTTGEHDLLFLVCARLLCALDDPCVYEETVLHIDAHKEAQAVYSAAGCKLPTLSELSEEYDLLLSQKKQAGEQLSHLNDELKNLRHIKLNMDTLLDDERFEEGQTQRMRDAEPEHEQHTTGKDR